MGVAFIAVCVPKDEERRTDRRVCVTMPTAAAGRGVRNRRQSARQPFRAGGMGRSVAVDPGGTVTRRNTKYSAALHGVGVLAACLILSAGCMVATGEAHPRAREALDRALALRQWEASEREFRRAIAFLEWETMRPALLRAGAIVALASGVFMVFALTTGRRPAAIS